MTTTTLATRILACALAFTNPLLSDAWAATPVSQQDTRSFDGCRSTTCVADAAIVHRHVRPPVHRHVHSRTVVVVRPVRPLVVRPYYGAVVAGVVLGTIIVASSVPPSPSPELCWYWSSSAQNRGYWDYCKPR